MRKVKFINETPWRTSELAAIVERVLRAVEDQSSIPEEIVVRCGRTNDRKPMEQRCRFFRNSPSVPRPLGYNNATLTIPCEAFPVRALAAVLARGFDLMNNPDHTLRPLRERVRVVRVIKAAGRLPLTRVGQREQRRPAKPNKQRRIRK